MSRPETRDPRQETGGVGLTNSLRLYGLPSLVSCLMSLVCLGLAGPAWADTLKPESRITAVTVFPDRAGVTRAATLNLPKGSHTIKVAPLPSQVEAESVAAKASGEAEVTLYGVRLVTTQLEAAQDPKVKELEDLIRRGERFEREARKKKEILAQERTYLSSIQAASSEQVGKDLVTKSPSASDAAALLAFLDEAFLKNLDREEAIDDGEEIDGGLEGNARELDKLRRELADLAQGRQKQETAILVDVEAEKAGAFRLEVSYRVPGASWQPSYEARTSTASNEVELVSYGVIRQRTGEDWTDAQLVLSTAKPAISGSMPELAPWFLRPWQPVPAASGVMKMARMDAAAPAEEAQRQDGRMKEEERPGMNEAKMAYAAVESQGPSVTFRLPAAQSIPSDWQPHKVPVGSQRFKAELAYEATPKLMPYAFLRAKVTNATGTFFLPGPAAVFLDGAFVATAALAQIAPGEAFDLYLGADERVKVERKQLKERVEVSLLPGLRGKMKSIDYEYLTTVENYTGRRIVVTVFDQIPVSEREEIVVESIKPVPGEVEKDKEKPGVFSWKQDLSQNQKQELHLSYRIRYPVDMQVQ